MILGIDESGTGAWAGPFYIFGVLVRDETEFRVQVGALNDSKKLSDKKRRLLAPEIRRHAFQVYGFEGTVEAIRKDGQGATWRRGVADILRRASEHRPTVYVDGRRNPRLVVPPGMEVNWEVQGDTKFPSIMAASILAKTQRNDDMILLAKQHPQYDWETNAGYPAPKHLLAVQKFGATPHHRPIHTLGNTGPEKKGLVEDDTILDLFKE